MAEALLYLDASALVKLVREETESHALLLEVNHWPELVTSVVGEIEVRRVARRGGAASPDALIEQLGLVELDRAVRALAVHVGSSTLRSLDAIHLASALSLGDELGAFCCYDRRLLAEAESAGLAILAPGLDRPA